MENVALKPLVRNFLYSFSDKPGQEKWETRSLLFEIHDLKINKTKINFFCLSDETEEILTGLDLNKNFSIEIENDKRLIEETCYFTVKKVTVKKFELVPDKILVEYPKFSIEIQAKILKV